MCKGLIFLSMTFCSVILAVYCWTLSRIKSIAKLEKINSSILFSCSLFGLYFYSTIQFVCHLAFLRNMSLSVQLASLHVFTSFFSVLVSRLLLLFWTPSLVCLSSFDRISCCSKFFPIRMLNDRMIRTTSAHTTFIIRLIFVFLSLVRVNEDIIRAKMERFSRLSWVFLTSRITYK